MVELTEELKREIGQVSQPESNPSSYYRTSFFYARNGIGSPYRI